MFKFTIHISTFILSFGFFLSYLTGFQPLAPAPAQQAEQYPLAGFRPEHDGQAMSSAALLSAQGSPSSAPTVKSSDLSGKYRGCVLEKLNAQQAADEADKERSGSAMAGVSWHHLQMLAPLLHYDPRAALS
jgi:hypothetical protein